MRRCYPSSGTRHFRLPPHRFARGGHTFRAAPFPSPRCPAPATKDRAYVAVNLHFSRKLHKFSGDGHSAFHRILHRARKVAADGLTNCGYCYTISINQAIFAAFRHGRGAAYCFLQAVGYFAERGCALHFALSHTRGRAFRRSVRAQRAVSCLTGMSNQNSKTFSLRRKTQ